MLTGTAAHLRYLRDYCCPKEEEEEDEDEDNEDKGHQGRP